MHVMRTRTRTWIWILLENSKRPARAHQKICGHGDFQDAFSYVSGASRYISLSARDGFFPHMWNGWFWGSVYIIQVRGKVAATTYLALSISIYLLLYKQDRLENKI